MRMVVLGFYEKKQVKGDNGEVVHMMSNGLGYRVNEKGKWEMLG